jgi:glycine/sarcosine N-methyltransferase
MTEEKSPDPKDPFSRANYRSLIAWPARIRREAPFLDRALADLPDRSVADLGCGTGEHARHLASKGFRVAGMDVSESMIADAASEPVPSNLRFVLGDLRDADRVLGERFGAAIVLGNTIPFFLTEEDLGRALGAASRLLLPGGRLLFQVLNYERLYARKERHLPLNFNDGPDGTVVFLRLLDLREGGRVLFFPTTVMFRPESAEKPVEIVRSRRVELRAWTRAELLPALAAAGLGEIETFGGMEGQPFEPLASQDLVVAARKAVG